MTDYLTDQELADALDISCEYVQAQCRSRRWPHLRVGRSYRFTPGHVAHIETVLEVPVAEQVAAAQSWGQRKRGA